MTTSSMVHVPAHMKDSIEGDLSGSFAKKIVRACFEDGPELEIKSEFYTLWGKVVCKRRNSRTTVTEIMFLNGDALETFKEKYL